MSTKTRWLTAFAFFTLILAVSCGEDPKPTPDPIDDLIKPGTDSSAPTDTQSGSIPFAEILADNPALAKPTVTDRGLTLYLTQLEPRERELGSTSTVTVAVGNRTSDYVPEHPHTLDVTVDFIVSGSLTGELIDQFLPVNPSDLYKLGPRSGRAFYADLTCASEGIGSYSVVVTTDPPDDVQDIDTDPYTVTADGVVNCEEAPADDPTATPTGRVWTLPYYVIDGAKYPRDQFILGGDIGEDRDYSHCAPKELFARNLMYAEGDPGLGIRTTLVITMAITLDNPTHVGISEQGSCGYGDADSFELVSFNADGATLRAFCDAYADRFIPADVALERFERWGMPETCLVGLNWIDNADRGRP